MEAPVAAMKECLILMVVYKNKYFKFSSASCHLATSLEKSLPEQIP